MNPRLLAALLLTACGPTPSNGNTGGGVGGGGGGSSGGGGGAGGGTPQPQPITITVDGCGALTPCGGNPLGTWHYTSACVRNPFTRARDACSAITFSNLHGTTKGSLQFSAAQVERHLETTVSGTLNVPASCLMGVLTCAQMQSTLRQSQPSATCTASGGGCSCDVTDTTLISDDKTYGVSGSTITVGASTYDYCIASGRLTYRQTDSASAEDGLMEVTRQ